MAGEQGGLLAFLNTPEGQGLLAGAFGGLAGARRGQPLNSIGRAGMAGLAGYTNAQDQEQKLTQDAQRTKLFDAQMQGYQADVATKQNALQQQQARQSYLGSVGQVTSPKIDAAPNQFNPMAWLGMGGSVDEARALAGSKDWGAPEVARTVEVDDGQGGKQTMQLDKMGRPVGQALPGYVAPVQVNQGNKISFVKPGAGVSLPVGMSPSERDASARGWAGVGIDRQRLTQSQQPKPEFKDGQWVLAPADLKPGESRAVAGASGQGAKDANDALALIKQAREILPDATGSYGGAAIDHGARFFGMSTDGAKAGAKLKAIAGMLTSKMPKMSGPQSDKDVVMYREMAGRVGDETLPISERVAALDAVEEIQGRYASGQGGKPPVRIEPARSPTGLRFMGFE